jgi:hypothetical protein
MKLRVQRSQGIEYKRVQRGTLETYTDSLPEER